MARHNLNTVVSFEVKRTLTKRRFWFTSLIGPVFVAVVIALVVSSNAATNNRIDLQKKEKFTFVYSDASGFVNPTVARAMGGSKAPDPARAIADVKSGKGGAYFEYPSNPAKQTTKVYGADKGIFENGKYSALATELLVASARAKIGNMATLAQGNFPVVATTYKAGQESGGIADIIPPLMFLVIFYLVLVVLGNQMLTSLLEEKETRVTEMILTTLDPTTLVIGKVVSLFIIGLVQMVVFAVPVIIGYVFFRTPLGLPLIDLSGLLAHPGSYSLHGHSGRGRCDHAHRQRGRTGLWRFDDDDLRPVLRGESRRFRSQFVHRAGVHVLPLHGAGYCDAPQWVRVAQRAAVDGRHRRAVRARRHRAAPRRAALPLWIHRVLQEGLAQGRVRQARVGRLVA